LLPPDVIFYGYNAPNSISAGARPQTLLGELTALPHCWGSLQLTDLLGGFEGPTSKGRDGKG